MKLSEEALRAVVALRGNHDFAILMGAVATHTSTLNERHIKQPASDEYARGKLAGFSELLETVNDAAKTLEKAAGPKT